MNNVEMIPEKFSTAICNKDVIPFPEDETLAIW